MISVEVYQENGYDSRDDYLNSLSEDYGVPIDAVHALAEILGPDEDFDGLVSNLEGAMFGGWFDEIDGEEDEEDDDEDTDETGD